MKNHNIYKFTGNITSAIKNADISQFIIFPSISCPLNRIFDSFSDKKEIEPSDDFNYKQTLIKFYSSFRIGIQKIHLIKPENIITTNYFNKKEFTILIKSICKKFKNSINAIYIPNQLIQYRKDIIDILENNVRNTKIIILN